MTTLEIQCIALLLWLCVVTGIVGVGYAIAVGVYRISSWLWRKFTAWRAERLVNNRRRDIRTDAQISAGMKGAQRRGWLPPENFL